MPNPTTLPDHELNALGASLGMTLLPSVPQLDCGAAAALLCRTLAHPDGPEPLFTIDASFPSPRSPAPEASS